MGRAPYEPVAADAFEYPNGAPGNMAHVVDAERDPRLCKQEIMLLQVALGVDPDGLIGPDTRKAAIEAHKRRPESRDFPETDEAYRQRIKRMPSLVGTLTVLEMKLLDVVAGSALDAFGEYIGLKRLGAA